MNGMSQFDKDAFYVNSLILIFFFNHELIQMTRCGFPCCHVFGIIGEMSHEMISVQYWLVYHPHYGDDTELGRALLLAQS